MSLEIGDAVSAAVDKLTTKAGIELALLSSVVSLLSTLGSNTLLLESYERFDLPEGSASGVQFALPVDPVVAGVLAVVAWVVGLVLAVLVLRAMSRPASELDSFPDHLLDSMAKTVGFLIVANVLVSLAVLAVPALAGGLVGGLLWFGGFGELTAVLGGGLVGFLLLLTVGLYVGISLVFSQVYVAVEGAGPVEALSESWALASGERLAVFLLLLVNFGIAAVVGGVGGVLGLVSPVASAVIGALIGGFINVLTTAIVVDGYLQLSGERRSDGPDGDEPAGTPTV